MPGGSRRLLRERTDSDVASPESPLLADAGAAARGPLVAGLVVPGGSAGLRLEAAELLAKRVVSFNGEQMELVVAAPAGKNGASLEHSATELDKLADELGDSLKGSMVRSCTWLWPLHDRAADVRFKKTARSYLVEDGVELGSVPIARLVLAKLFILMPPEGGLVVRTVRNVYGNRAAYAIFWNCVFVQQLWVLAAVAAVSLVLQATLSDHAGGEVMNYGTLVWSFWFLWHTWSHGTVMGLGGPADNSGVARVRDYLFDPGSGSKVSPLTSVAIALLTMLFTCLVTFVALCYIQFMAWLTFDWGDCIALQCRSPDEKYGFFGVLAEITLDVGFALLFVTLRAVAGLYGNWAAKRHFLQFAIDRKMIAKMYSLLVECVDTIGAFSLFGLLFVTPWRGSAQHDSPELVESNCSDALLYDLVGRSSFFCLARQIGVDRRRELYRRMLLGPFMVAPFIRILVKFVIPMVVHRWNQYESDVPCGCINATVNFLRRVLAFIFVFDSDSVGGLRFVLFGDPLAGSMKAKVAPPPLFAGSRMAAGAAAAVPLGGAEAAPPPPPPGADAVDEGGESSKLLGSAPQETADAAEGAAAPGAVARRRSSSSLAVDQLLDSALQEMQLKEFEVDAELLEVKLNFLFVIMFASIMPEGVFTTLLGRMLESWTDLTKLLFLKRRPFPDQGMSIAVQHYWMKTFIAVAIVVKVVWSILLSFFVYA